MSDLDNYIYGLKLNLEYSKISRLNIPEEVDFTIDDVLERLDNEGIEYSRYDYINEDGEVKSLPEDTIYCDEFYTKENI